MGGVLSTRQHWVLLAVAGGRVERDPLYGGICTLDGVPATWTVLVLAVRGLIAFDPMSPCPPRLTGRGAAALSGLLARPSTS